MLAFNQQERPTNTPSPLAHNTHSHIELPIADLLAFNLKERLPPPPKYTHTIVMLHAYNGFITPQNEESDKEIIYE